MTQRAGHRAHQPRATPRDPRARDTNSQVTAHITPRNLATRGVCARDTPREGKNENETAGQTPCARRAHSSLPTGGSPAPAGGDLPRWERGCLTPPHHPVFTSPAAVHCDWQPAPAHSFTTGHGRNSGRPEQVDPTERGPLGNGGPSPFQGGGTNRMPTKAPTPCPRCHTLGPCQHRDAARRSHHHRTWTETSARILANHRANHGNWCPGYHDHDPHPTPDLTVHHVNGRARTGDDDDLVVLCRTENSRLGG